MPYTPNNPYIPGDPYSYDLKWIVSQLKNISGVISGLSDTIAAAVNARTLAIVNNVAELKSMNAAENTIVATKGYHSAGDNGAAFYWITTGDPSDANDGNIVLLDNGLLAIFLPVGELTSNQFGCNGSSDDGSRFQSMLQYASLHNISVNVDIVNLTGHTIDMSFRGINAPDDVSIYTRNNLNIKGVNRGLIFKNDAGYMFTSSGSTRDLVFSRIKFEGMPTTPNSYLSVPATYVFDAEHLLNIHTEYCSFIWLDTVYKASTGNVQGIYSQHNIYSHNKTIIDLGSSNVWTAFFDHDLIEDGGSFFVSGGATIRAVTISNCTIEGFTLNPAIRSDGILSEIHIINNYFESNLGHIILSRLFNGSITGNYFAGRTGIAASEQIHCIEFAPYNQAAQEINNNQSVETNPNTTLLYVNTTSPYYTAAKRIITDNKIESGATYSNLPDTFISETAFKNYGINSITDIITDLQATYPAITSGSATLVQKGNVIIVALSNLVINAAISSGTCDLSSHITGTPVASIPATIGGGSGYITTSKGLGLRLPAAGTYNAEIIAIC